MNQLDKAALQQTLSYMIATLELLKFAKITECRQDATFCELLSLKDEGEELIIPLTENVSESLDLLKKFYQELCVSGTNRDLPIWQPSKTTGENSLD